MRAVQWNRCLLYWAIVVPACAADLLSKSAVFAWLGMPGKQEPWWLIPPVLGFQTSLNQGALFGLGQGMVPVFAGLSIAAALGIFIWLFWAGAAADRFLTITLALITAGILGNLYDRLGMPGLIWPDGTRVYAVRDWILVMIGRWPWPTFNVADSLLVSGAVLLVWHAYRIDAQHSPTAS